MLTWPGVFIGKEAPVDTHSQSAGWNKASTSFHCFQLRKMSTVLKYLQLEKILNMTPLLETVVGNIEAACLVIKG